MTYTSFSSFLKNLESSEQHFCASDILQKMKAEFVYSPLSLISPLLFESVVSRKSFLGFFLNKAERLFSVLEFERFNWQNAILTHLHQHSFSQISYNANSLQEVITLLEKETSQRVDSPVSLSKKEEITKTFSLFDDLPTSFFPTWQEVIASLNEDLDERDHQRLIDYIQHLQTEPKLSVPQMHNALILKKEGQEISQTLELLERFFKSIQNDFILIQHMRAQFSTVLECKVNQKSNLKDFCEDIHQTILEMTPEETQWLSITPPYSSASFYKFLSLFFPNSPLRSQHFESQKLPFINDLIFKKILNSIKIKRDSSLQPEKDDLNKTVVDQAIHLIPSHAQPLLLWTLTKGTQGLLPSNTSPFIKQIISYSLPTWFMIFHKSFTGVLQEELPFLEKQHVDNFIQQTFEQGLEHACKRTLFPFIEKNIQKITHHTFQSLAACLTSMLPQWSEFSDIINLSPQLSNVWCRIQKKDENYRIEIFSNYINSQSHHLVFSKVPQNILTPSWIYQFLKFEAWPLWDSQVHFTIEDFKESCLEPLKDYSITSNFSKEHYTYNSDVLSSSFSQDYDLEKQQIEYTKISYPIYLILAYAKNHLHTELLFNPSKAKELFTLCQKQQQRLEKRLKTSDISDVQFKHLWCSLEDLKYQLKNLYPLIDKPKIPHKIQLPVIYQKSIDIALNILGIKQYELEVIRDALTSSLDKEAHKAINEIIDECLISVENSPISLKEPPFKSILEIRSWEEIYTLIATTIKKHSPLIIFTSIKMGSELAFGYPPDFSFIKNYIIANVCYQILPYILDVLLKTNALQLAQIKHYWESIVTLFSEIVLSIVIKSVIYVSVDAHKLQKWWDSIKSQSDNILSESLHLDANIFENITQEIIQSQINKSPEERISQEAIGKLNDTPGVLKLEQTDETTTESFLSSFELVCDYSFESFEQFKTLSSLEKLYALKQAIEQDTSLDFFLNAIMEIPSANSREWETIDLSKEIPHIYDILHHTLDLFYEKADLKSIYAHKTYTTVASHHLLALLDMAVRRHSICCEMEHLTPVGFLWFVNLPCFCTSENKIIEVTENVLDYFKLSLPLRQKDIVEKSLFSYKTKTASDNSLYISEHDILSSKEWAFYKKIKDDPIIQRKIVAWHQNLSKPEKYLVLEEMDEQSISNYIGSMSTCEIFSAFLENQEDFLPRYFSMIKASQIRLNYFLSSPSICENIIKKESSFHFHFSNTIQGHWHQKKGKPPQWIPSREITLSCETFCKTIVNTKKHLNEQSIKKHLIDDLLQNHAFIDFADIELLFSPKEESDLINQLSLARQKHGSPQELIAHKKEFSKQLIFSVKKEQLLKILESFSENPFAFTSHSYLQFFLNVLCHNQKTCEELLQSNPQLPFVLKDVFKRIWTYAIQEKQSSLLLTIISYNEFFYLKFPDIFTPSQQLIEDQKHILENDLSLFSENSSLRRFLCKLHIKTYNETLIITDSALTTICEGIFLGNFQTNQIHENLKEIIAQFLEKNPEKHLLWSSQYHNLYIDAYSSITQPYNISELSCEKNPSSRFEMLRIKKQLRDSYAFFDEQAPLEFQRSSSDDYYFSHKHFDVYYNKISHNLIVSIVKGEQRLIVLSQEDLSGIRSLLYRSAKTQQHNSIICLQNHKDSTSSLFILDHNLNEIDSLNIHDNTIYLNWKRGKKASQLCFKIPQHLIDKYKLSLLPLLNVFSSENIHISIKTQIPQLILGHPESGLRFNLERKKKTFKAYSQDLAPGFYLAQEQSHPLVPKHHGIILENDLQEKKVIIKINQDLSVVQPFFNIKHLLGSLGETLCKKALDETSSYLKITPESHALTSFFQSEFLVLDLNRNNQLSSSQPKEAAFLFLLHLAQGNKEQLKNSFDAIREYASIKPLHNEGIQWIFAATLLSIFHEDLNLYANIIRLFLIYNQNAKLHESKSFLDSFSSAQKKSASTALFILIAHFKKLCENNYHFESIESLQIFEFLETTITQIVSEEITSKTNHFFYEDSIIHSTIKITIDSIYLYLLPLNLLEIYLKLLMEHPENNATKITAIKLLYFCKKDEVQDPKFKSLLNTISSIPDTIIETIFQENPKQKFSALLIKNLSSLYEISSYNSFKPFRATTFSIIGRFCSQAGEQTIAIENIKTYIKGHHLNTTQLELYPPLDPITFNPLNIKIYFLDYWRLALRKTPRNINEHTDESIFFQTQCNAFAYFIQQINGHYDQETNLLIKLLKRAHKTPHVFRNLHLLKFYETQLTIFQNIPSIEFRLEEVLSLSLLLWSRDIQKNIWLSLFSEPQFLFSSFIFGLKQFAYSSTHNAKTLIKYGTTFVNQSVYKIKRLGRAYNIFQSKAETNVFYKISSEEDFEVIDLESHTSFRASKKQISAMTSTDYDAFSDHLIENYFTWDILDENYTTIPPSATDEEHPVVIEKITSLQESLQLFLQNTKTEQRLLFKIEEDLPRKIFLITQGLSKKIATLKENLQEKERDLIAWIDSLQFKTVSDEQIYLLLFSQKGHQLSIEVLIKTFLRMNFKDLKKLLNTDHEDHFLKFQKDILNYLLEATFCQKLERALKQTYEISSKITSKEIIQKESIQKLGFILSQKRVYSFEEDSMLNRFNLVFEYKTGLLLKKLQHQQLQTLLQEIGYVRAAQLLMGAGKTFYMLKQASAILADKKYLIINSFPQSVALVNTKEMSRSSKAIFDQEIHSFKIERNRLKTQQALQTYYDVAREAIQKQSAFSHTQSDMQSLELNFITLMSEVCQTSSHTEEQTEKLVLSAQILNLMRKYGILNTDEWHLTICPKKEKNYPLSEKTFLENETISSIHLIMEFCLKNEEITSILKIAQNTQASIPDSIIKTRIIPLITAYVVQSPLLEIPLEEQETFQNYFQGNDTETRLPPLIEKLMRDKSISSKKRLEQLGLIRGILSIILLPCLKSISYVDCGPARNYDPQKEFAVVYEGNRNPLENRIIQSPIEALIKTYMMHSVTPLSHMQSLKLLQYFQQEALKEVASSKFPLSFEETYAFKTCLTLIKIPLPQTTDSEKNSSRNISKLTDLINSTPSSFSCIDVQLFYVKQFPAHQIFFYEKGAKSNAINYISMFHATYAYTGTLDKRGCYPKQCDLILESTTDGESLAQIEKSPIKILTSSLIQDSIDETLSLITDPESDIYALIDAGALCRGFYNQTIAQMIWDKGLEISRPTIKAIIYYDQNNLPQCLFKNGDSKPFDECSLEEHERLTFFDHNHTESANISQPFSSQALLTFGEKTTFSLLSQAFYRMRGVRDRKQSVTLVVLEHVAKLFEETITTQTLIKYSIKIQEESFLELNFKSDYNKVINIFRRILLDEIIECLIDKNFKKALGLFTQFQSLFIYKQPKSFFRQYGLISEKVNPHDQIEDLKTKLMQQYETYHREIDQTILKQIRYELSLIDRNTHYPEHTLLYKRKGEIYYSCFGDSIEVNTDTNQDVQQSTNISLEQNLNQEVFHDDSFFDPTEIQKPISWKIDSERFHDEFSVGISKIYKPLLWSRCYQTTITPSTQRPIYSLKECFIYQNTFQDIAPYIRDNIFICNAMLQLVGAPYQQKLFGEKQKSFEYIVVILTKTSFDLKFILTDSSGRDFWKQTSLSEINEFYEWGVYSLAFKGFLSSNFSTQDIKSNSEIKDLSALCRLFNGSSTYSSEEQDSLKAWIRQQPSQIHIKKLIDYIARSKMLLKKDLYEIDSLLKEAAQESIVHFSS